MKSLSAFPRTLLFIAMVLLPLPAQGQEGAINCDDLKARPYPQWFTDAKLGIFIHWGVYSVPAYGGLESYGEWFLRGLQVGDTLRTNFMKRVYGDTFTYRDFAPLFHAELFRPDEWAQLFKDAGAKYIVMVTKHHDGYCLWPSRYAPGWNSMDVGPHRDLVGELAAAVRKKGLVFGAYYSLAEWNNPLHRWYTDPDDSIAPYVEQHMIPQFKEMVSAYKPRVIFADGEWSNTAAQWHSAELISWYYNRVGDSAIVNNRWGHGCDVGFLTPEYSSGLEASERPWTEVRGLGRSFGLNRNEPLEAYMTPAQLIRFFVTAVANGGGMILNVGPRSDGQIPLLQQERLKQLGTWLKVNGEAIYGARMWKRTGAFRKVTLERVDPKIDFNWVRNAPGPPIAEDDFEAEWNGWMMPQKSGKYLFAAEADDAVRVLINNKVVAQSGLWGTDNRPAKISKEIRLKKGEFYAIKVFYRENKQNASVRVLWTLPDGTTEVIPEQVLYTAPAENAGQGLHVVYSSQKQTQAYTVNNGHLYVTALEWPGDTLEVPLAGPADHVEVSMLGRAGNIPATWRQDTLLIDLSGIKFNELTSCYAWTFRISGVIQNP